MKRQVHGITLAFSLSAWGCGAAEGGVDDDSVARVHQAIEIEDGECVMIFQEAHSAALTTYGSSSVVYTDPFQTTEGPEPQYYWCFDLVSSLTYRITPYDQPNKYLDAFTQGNDYQVMLRDYQSNDTQRWYIENDFYHPDTYRILQIASNRFLDAYTGGAGLQNVVTRTYQNNKTQRWRADYEL